MYRLVDLKNKFMVTGGEGRRGERLGVWNWHIHTVLFRLYLHFVLEILRAVGIYQIDGNVLPWNSWKASWGKWVLICVLKTGWKVRLEEAHVNRSRNVCVPGSMSPKSDERPHRGLTDWGSLRSLSKQESVKPLSVGRVLALLLFSHHVMSSSLRPHGLYVAYQDPPSIGFSRQEYWSRSPFPSPGDLPYPGIEPRSPEMQADSLLSEPPGKLV